jgi:hypothetical protein
MFRHKQEFKQELKFFNQMFLIVTPNMHNIYALLTNISILEIF